VSLVRGSPFPTDKKGKGAPEAEISKGVNRSDVDKAAKTDGKIDAGNAFDPANNPPYQPTGIANPVAESSVATTLPLLNQLRFAEMIGPYLQGQVGQATSGINNAVDKFQQGFAQSGQSLPTSIQDQLAGQAGQVADSSRGMAQAFQTSSAAGLPYQLLMQLVGTLQSQQESAMQREIDLQTQLAVQRQLASQQSQQQKQSSGGLDPALLAALAPKPS